MDMQQIRKVMARTNIFIQCIEINSVYYHLIMPLNSKSSQSEQLGCKLHFYSVNTFSFVHSCCCLVVKWWHFPLRTTLYIFHTANSTGTEYKKNLGLSFSQAVALFDQLHIKSYWSLHLSESRLFYINLILLLED